MKKERLKVLIQYSFQMCMMNDFMSSAMMLLQPQQIMDMDIITLVIEDGKKD